MKESLIILINVL